MTIEERNKKMLSGVMYNDLAAELVEKREQVIFLTNKYDKSFGKPIEKREKILKTLLGSIGNNVHFEPGFRCEFGFNISIGNDFYANYDCIMLDGNKIEIGDNVLFEPRAGIYTSNHAIDPSERQNGGCFSKPVKIGNNVWMGGDVKVLQGVSIGDNTVIGAGSVVTRDIPANVVAACKVLRKITDSDKTGYIPN